MPKLYRTKFGMKFKDFRKKYKKEHHRKRFKNKEQKFDQVYPVSSYINFFSKTKKILGRKPILAAYRVVVKQTKKVGLVWSNVRPDRKIYKKKKGVRMGGGKGKVFTWASYLPAYTRYLEVCVHSSRYPKLKKTFVEAYSKLPVRLKSCFV